MELIQRIDKIGLKSEKLSIHELQHHTNFNVCLYLIDYTISFHIHIAARAIALLFYFHPSYVVYC